VEEVEDPQEVEPVQPVEPVERADPVVPVEPVEPMERVEPIESVELIEQAGQSVSIIDGREHRVDPRSVTLDRVVGLGSILASAVVPFVGFTIGWGLGGIPARVYFSLLAGGVVLFVLSLVIGYKWPELHHRHLRYRVDESGVRIRRGVLWRTVISIPTSRVQHTDVSQGPVQRSYGLATLTVHTAGTEGASISLSGLEHGVAKRLRDHLLPDHEPDDV